VEIFRRPASDNGPSLLLLHGIGSNAHSFEPLMRALPLSIGAIAWNAPGYGESRLLAAAAPAPRDYAAVLEAVLNEIGLPRTVLVGHSLGALFAASFAAAYPDRVAALALLSPALGYHVPSGESLPPGLQSRIDELDAVGPAAFSQKRAARLVGDPDGKQAVLDAVRRAMAAVHPKGYAQAVRALGAGDMVADLARIAAPALVAIGSKDVVTPPANGRTARDAFGRKVAYHEIDGAGHALPQEEPALVARLLEQLVEGRADA